MPLTTKWTGGRPDELAELYLALAAPLERIVRGQVRAPDAVIEDACGVAWSRFMRHRQDVPRGAALSWLAMTAVREAIKLMRREGRDLPLDAAGAGAGSGPVVEPPASAPGPEDAVVLRDRLATLRKLPERQQRLLWMRALGFSYAEIEQRTGDTPRTIDRQLVRARRAVRALAAQ